MLNRTLFNDIKRDSGQQPGVSRGHLVAFTRLKSSFEAWWDELEPTFGKICPIHPIHPDECPNLLTSHDVMVANTTAKAAWDQASARKAIDVPRMIGC